MSHKPRGHGKLFAEKAAQQGVKLIAPDGAWGWVIVAAFAVSHFFVVPIFATFGMVFADKFRRLGINATDISVILNMNSSVGFGFGLMNGPLLRRFTYRQLSTCGTLFLFLGTMLIAFSNTMTFFIFSFGITFALGFALLSQPQSYAINSYFMRRKGRAVSVAVGGCGFGSVVMPLLVGKLLQWYGPEGTMLIMAGLILHCLPASLLLQPVRWHMVRGPAPQEVATSQTEQLQVASREEKHSSDVVNANVTQRPRLMTVTSADVECRSLYTPDAPHAAPRDATHQLAELNTDYHWWSSEDTVDLESVAPMLKESQLADKILPPVATNAKQLDNSNNNVSATKQMQQFKAVSIWKRFKTRSLSYANSIVIFFDLTLLCDPIFASICVGIAMAMFADINFSLLFSFILREMHGLNIDQMSHVMSVMAACDIALRFSAPYIGEAAQLSHKTMYIISIVLLVVVRSLLLVIRDYIGLIVLGCGLGVAKGLRSVFMPLVIPSYIPLDRLAAATGLQMVCNGILFLTLGPVLGMLRDLSGSYWHVVAAMNVMSLMTVVLWTSQSLLATCRKPPRVHV